MICPNCGHGINPAAALGRLGGSARTAAQQAARRENGKKGGRPTPYAVTYGSEVNFVGAIRCATLQSAKRQATIALRNYDAVAIWLHSPESAEYRACWVRIDSNGQPLGDMRESDAFYRLF